MSTHAHEQAATVPAQAGPPQTKTQTETQTKTRVDHVSAHATRCYWDHRECRWVCRPD